MKSSFAKKLILSYLSVVAISLLITGAYASYRLKTTFLTALEQSLGAQALLMRHIIAPLAANSQGERRFHEVAHSLGSEMGCRVTIVRGDGVVVGDSDRTREELVGMDNHADRPEIRAALVTGTGESMRYSRTLHSDMLYLAVPIFLSAPSHSAARGVLRVALPLTEVRRRVSAFQTDLMKAGVAALGVAFLIAWGVARKTLHPLNTLAETAREIGQGQFPREVRLSSSDEFGQLARTFSEMSGRIQEKVQELSQERAQLSAILAALVEGIVAVDHQGCVLFLNAAAEKLFAVSSDECKGRPILEALRHSAFHDVIRSTLRERQPVTQEITIHSPQERSLQVHALPVSYGENRTGALVALHDVTELRKLENLRQEFVANVSHELKTPLTAIKGYVETLLDGALEDKAHNREFTEIIGEHTRHLSLLIDDVLDLSAIEAKRVQYRFAPVELRELMERLVKGLAPMAKAKKVTIAIRLPETLPPVRADRDKLAQILMNLLDNAIKFNKTGGEVVVTGKEENDSISIVISDTGPGISREDLPRIFERFYRADKARSHDVAGTGLGLAIVKHLVEAHQGKVTVESRQGEGATFRFTLPKA